MKSILMLEELAEEEGEENQRLDNLLMFGEGLGLVPELHSQRGGKEDMRKSNEIGQDTCEKEKVGLETAEEGEEESMTAKGRVWTSLERCPKRGIAG
ncbi:hypothetical protein PPACK8108_LOCUS22677 [Phakopsora pachyrhizi]|uniref:Uncharacterized protein n=1 Tax=Phakopsora pachyrhizi TaxID=170000 RepID=A0AAV0BKH8_PHAPC|nr:hypothetical protein PPACK8108_LOCUS22677 [Phakopsora pachyrhizi]